MVFTIHFMKGVKPCFHVILDLLTEKSYSLLLAEQSKAALKMK